LTWHSHAGPASDVDERACSVRAAQGRLSLADFLALVASHRATLSPPGSGYDCLRTWQAIALGCVPLVTHDAAFDERLLTDSGAVPVPRPEELTPEGLRDLLARVQPPSAEHAAALGMPHWRAVWADILANRQADVECT
jgi:hypothetical protein